jgi:hypothetical protein
LSGIRLVLVATLVCLAVSAQLVASFERQACPAADCGSRPVSYPAALTWILQHVLPDQAA